MSRSPRALRSAVAATAAAVAGILVGSMVRAVRPRSDGTR
jgi:hypothetical protein